MKRKLTTVCVLLCLAMIVGLAGCGTAPTAAAPLADGTAPTAAAPSGNGTALTAAAPSGEAVSEITVSASGTVRLVPDKATVSFGVMTQEQTAELAQSMNSEAVKNVIEVLTGRGIEEKSIRTAYYSMYPQYDWSDGNQRITGYNVTTTLTVQDQNIEDLGTLFSACVAAGVNNVDSVRFLCSGYDEAYRQALAQAVAASKDKAEALAQAAGKTLGEPITVTEGWQDTSARYGLNAEVPLAMEKAAAQDVSGPSFQPGETEITANVTVTYGMK